MIYYVYAFVQYIFTLIFLRLSQEICITVFNDWNWGETLHQLVCLDFHFGGSRLVFRDDSQGFTFTHPLICQWSEVYVLYWLVFVLGAVRPTGGLFCMPFFGISFTCCSFNPSLVLCVHFSFQRLVLSWSPPVPQNHLLSNTASNSWAHFLVPDLLSGLWTTGYGFQCFHIYNRSLSLGAILVQS